MAAGLGSRYAGGIKQLEPVGMNGEIIMDYSIHDAIKAGFNRIVFVIRKEIEAEFRECIGCRIDRLCAQQHVEVAYAFQDLRAIPAGFSVPEGRRKPWGTGHAVLAAKDLIPGPFVVLNADDYYGKEAFVKMREYLTQPHPADECCMAGFILKNTLSPHGGVTRGVCRVDGDRLLDIAETRHIIKTEQGVFADGVSIDENAYVSMNMWGFPSTGNNRPQFLDMLEANFIRFFEERVSDDPMQAEYLLPIIIGEGLRKNQLAVKVLETNEKWFGITYKEDTQAVRESFHRMIADGVYRQRLYADMEMDKLYM